MYLHFKNLTIRNASKELSSLDAKRLADWWNDGAVMAHAGFPNGIGTTEAAVRQKLSSGSDEGGRRLILEANRQPVGEAVYFNLENGSAEIGIKICEPDCQQRGYGRLFLSMLIQALFDQYGYEKIVLDTNLENHRAQHVYELLGFQKVRVTPDAFRDQLGRPQTSVDYELTKENFINFAAGPSLSDIPRLELGTWPTPLHRLKRLEESLGYGPIYCKRDDLTGIGCGGNKVRNLEYLLADALCQGATDIIASGGPQSNLCSLTAACCARQNLACHLVHDGEEGTRRGNQVLNHLLGVHEYYLGPVSYAKRGEQVEALAKRLSGEGRLPYIIHNGATTGLGSLGYAHAVEELLSQHPEPMTIFAPGGNGGIAAGLIYGNWLAGSPYTIVILSVEDDRETLSTHIRDAIREAETIVGLPMELPLEEACIIDDRFRGEGWGINTKEGEAAVHSFARLEGIFLENVYTGKPMAGMCAYLREKRVTGPVCFLHTGGFASLFAQY